MWTVKIKNVIFDFYRNKIGNFYSFAKTGDEQVKKRLQNQYDYAIIFRAVLDEPTACAKEVKVRERKDPSQVWQVHRPLRMR